jgi:hypothetical protein
MSLHDALQLLTPSLRQSLVRSNRPRKSEMTSLIECGWMWLRR